MYAVRSASKQHTQTHRVKQHYRDGQTRPRQTSHRLGQSINDFVRPHTQRGLAAGAVTDSSSKMDR